MRCLISSDTWSYVIGLSSHAIQDHDHAAAKLSQTEGSFWNVQKSGIYLVINEMQEKPQLYNIALIIQQSTDSRFSIITGLVKRRFFQLPLCYRNREQKACVRGYLISHFIVKGMKYLYFATFSLMVSSSQKVGYFCNGIFLEQSWDLFNLNSVTLRTRIHFDDYRFQVVTNSHDFTTCGTWNKKWYMLKISSFTS